MFWGVVVRPGDEGLQHLMRVQGLGVSVRGLGLGIRFWGLGIRFRDLGTRVSGRCSRYSWGSGTN